MIRLNNESDLNIFLKLLAEESVKDAKKRVNEAEGGYSKNMSLQKKKDEETYGSLDEIDEEIDDLADEEVVDATEPESEGFEEEEVEVEEKPADTAASFDAIKKAFNDARASHSIKREPYESELLAYYNRLTDAERKVLLTFLTSFSNILSGNVEGVAAQDPSDDPVNISIAFSEDEIQGDVAAASEEEEEGEVAGTEVEFGEEEEEDTSPPIKVSESQDFSSIRNKIKKLMRG